MVNVRAHERSLRRGAMGVHPAVVTGLGGRGALVGSLLSIAQLDDWGLPMFACARGIGVPLAQLCEEQLGRSLESAEQLIDVEPWRATTT